MEHAVHKVLYKLKQYTQMHFVLMARLVGLYRKLWWRVMEHATRRTLKAFASQSRL